MTMRTVFIHLFILYCLPLVGQLSADTLYFADNAFKTLDLTPYAGIYTDEEGAQTIEDILAADPAFSPDFEPDLPTDYPTAHWLKIDILAVAPISDRWLVFKNAREEYQYLANLDEIDAYFVQNDLVVAHYRTGVFVPRREKSIKERSEVNVIPFSIGAFSPTTLYVRIATAQKSEVMHVEMAVTDPVVNISHTSDRYKWDVYGSQAMHMIIAFYVFVFWFFVRHRAYLYFGLYCLFFSMHYFDIGPASNMIDLFFPNHPDIAAPVFILFAMGSMVFLLIFGRSFSEVEQRLPGWDKYFLVAIGIYSLFFLYILVMSLSRPYGLGQEAFFLVFILILPVSVKFVLGRHQLARIFGIGILWLVFWNMIGVLQLTGLLPEIFFVPWTVGQVGLLLVYALGLGYKIMDNERQKAQADRIRELDAVKSRFFANISHEFRTPLSLILGPVNQALENIPASEEIAEAEEVPVRGRHLKVVKRNALRLQHLVDQLLDLSKLDSGKMKLSLAEGNLIQFLRSIVFSFESLAERKHIHFQTTFPAGPASAWFDQDKLEKILVNLLSNAFKFTPEHGSIRVQVEDQGGSIRLQVSDSGPGMPAEEADKVFDRFYQVEGTETQGTGIGLALVKELVDLHGGQISVESVAGEGTTFRVTLPYRKELFGPEHTFFVKNEPATPAEKIMPAELEAAEEPAFENRRPAGAELPLALVVEDNPDLRYYISENIRDEYQVHLAVDGQSGLEMAVERVPDIIISDVMMPKKDGFELCAELKNDDRTSHIPVILLTARAGQQHKIEGLEQGADDYLTKPFDVRELRVRMSNLIEQRRRLRERFSGELKIRPTEVTLSSVDERFIRQVMAQIEENMENEFFSVEDLARTVGFSRSQLHRKLKALTDKSPNQLIREFRLTRARELLEQKTASVSEIAYQVGYSNLSYFSKSYKDQFGVLPSET